MVMGIHEPPPEFLTSGARVRQWRGFDNSRQLWEIERSEEAKAKRSVTESRNRGRAARIRAREQHSRDTDHLDRLAASSSSSPAAPSAVAPSSAKGGKLEVRFLVGGVVVSPPPWPISR